MKRKIRRIVDISMSIILLLLMLPMITGERIHEILGLAMFILVLIHIFLNRYWYTSLFRGRYGTYRSIITFIDLSLMVCFFMAALCGASLSRYVLSFLNGAIPSETAQRLLPGLAWWSFALMGLHLGTHVSAIISQFRLRYSEKRSLKVVFTAAAAYGFSALIRMRIHELLFFRNTEGIIQGNALRMLSDTALIFAFFCFVGEEISSLTLMLPKKKDRKQDIVYTILCIALAIVIGITIAQAMN